MQALFFLWCGKMLVKVDFMQTIAGCDLNGTARKLKKQTMLDRENLTADRCTIYMVKDCRLIFAGEE